MTSADSGSHAPAGDRPNLSGLFSGTVTPQRPGARPRLVTVTEPGDDGRAARAELPPWTVLDLMDPVRFVNRYFQVLQAMLDAGHTVALGAANVMVTASQRVGVPVGAAKRG